MRSSFDTRRWPQAEGVDARALTVAAAVVGSAVVGGVMSSQSQKSAANTAAAAQTQASEAGIAERRAEFGQVQSLLSPFVQAATGRPAGGGFGAGAGAGAIPYTAGNGGQVVPGGFGAMAPGAMESADQIRARLLPQFSTPGGTRMVDQIRARLLPQFSTPGGTRMVVDDHAETPITSWVTDPATVNEQGLSAAVQAELARQQAAAAQPAAASGTSGGMPTVSATGSSYTAPGGGGSLGAQLDVIGLNGPDAQQAAIANLQKMPAFTSALQLGENRLLQNASATGGLRGGNTQGALAYFAPSLLAQQINDYYGRLAGITSLGQNSAAMVGNAGMQTGAGVSDLLQQGGSAQAGAALANGRANSNLYSSMNGALGQYIGGGGTFGGFGSGFSPDAIQGAFAQTGAGGAGFGTGMAYGNQDYGLFI